MSDIWISFALGALAASSFWIWRIVSMMCRTINMRREAISTLEEANSLLDSKKRGGRMKLNRLSRFIRKAHRDMGVTPELREAFQNYKAITKERSE